MVENPGKILCFVYPCYSKPCFVCPSQYRIVLPKISLKHCSKKLLQERLRQGSECQRLTAMSYVACKMVIMVLWIGERIMSVLDLLYQTEVASEKARIPESVQQVRKHTKSPALNQAKNQEVPTFLRKRGRRYLLDGCCGYLHLFLLELAIIVSTQATTF